MDGAAFLHSQGGGKPGISTSGCLQPLWGWGLERNWGKFGEDLHLSTLCWVPEGGCWGSWLPCPLPQLRVSHLSCPGASIPRGKQLDLYSSASQTGCGENGLGNVCREAETRYVDPVQNLCEAAESKQGGR